MTKSVYGTFSGIKNKGANGVMDAVQVYPTTSFLDLPQMTDAQWESMTKEQQEQQLAWEANLVKACENLYVESSIK